MSFLSYVLTLTSFVNGFAEIPATLVSELGCHVGIHFKHVGFELYIYIYMYIVCLFVGWPHPMQNPGYATAACLIHRVTRYRGYRGACVGLSNPTFWQRNLL